MVKILPYLLIISIITFVLYPRANNSFKQYILGHTEAHKTVYVSEDFDEYEYDVIGEAMLEWQQETHNLVTFDMKFGFDKNILNKINNDPDSMILVKAAPKDSLIKNLDEVTEKTILGYFSSEDPVQKVFVVPDRMLNTAYFKAVVLHELGHSLGLPHLDTRGTIMYQYMEATYNLTPEDIAWFCKAYFCDPANF